MTQGYLRTKGVRASTTAISKLQQQVDPQAFNTRLRGVKVLNPVPYRADCFGHKLHLDQNEKLVMYGVFQVACIDGYSSQIIKHVVLPEKNNVLIYDKLFKPILDEKGVWSMLRTDHGTEFALVQFAQNMFQGYRLSTEGLPFVQSYSKNNLRIERWWVEVNHRVNYPIKKFLRDMEENGSLIYRNDTRWFIVGEFCRRVCEIGIERLVNSWNAHTVPHRGVPNDLETPVGVVSEDIPTGTVLANEYVRLGGSITRPGATHSIYDEVLADARDSHFFSVAGGFEDIYGFVMANRFDLFQSCLHEYVNLTQQYLPVEEA